MFNENFTFDSPRSPSLDSAITITTTRNSSRAISPCSMASAFPQPRYSVTDLAASFADQRIRKESAICYDSCEAYANNDDEADWSIPSIEDEDIQQLARSQTFPQRAGSPPRRAQRQANARLLCTASHRGDIAALVARMVERHDQCCITASESTSPAPEEDEGYDSDDRSMGDASRRSSSSISAFRPRTNFRRASDHTGACVSKRIRIRKDKNHRRIRSSEQSAS